MKKLIILLAIFCVSSFAQMVSHYPKIIVCNGKCSGVLDEYTTIESNMNPYNPERGLINTIMIGNYQPLNFYSNNQRKEMLADGTSALVADIEDDEGITGKYVIGLAGAVLRMGNNFYLLFSLDNVEDYFNNMKELEKAAY